MTKNVAAALIIYSLNNYIITPLRQFGNKTGVAVSLLQVYNISGMSTITQAFYDVKRLHFVPKMLRSMAQLDMPLSIGYGQTNSQPTTVRLMLEWLDAKHGQKVLDLGSGSGWTTALLGHIVGKLGTVYGVERIPELLEFGRRNCQAANVFNTEFFLASDDIGLLAHAPFDRILVSANANEFPKELLNQLKVGGKIVVPVNGIIQEVTKLARGKLKTKEHPSFIFVPLVK